MHFFKFRAAAAGGGGADPGTTEGTSNTITLSQGKGWAQLVPGTGLPEEHHLERLA